jgi:ABC-type multidrug transport system fused ATPase/permease subunit
MVITIAISFGLIVIILPWFLVPLVPFALLFAFITGFFRRSARELKRLDNMTRSPLVQHLQGTLQGIATIRAYGQQTRFDAVNQANVDDTTKTQWAFYAANRWLACRLDNITTLAAAVTVAICIASRGTLSPSLAALAVVQALQTGGIFQFATRLFTETEAQLTCVERLDHYSVGIPHEPLVAPGCAPLTEVEADAAVEACLARLDREEVAEAAAPSPSASAAGVGGLEQAGIVAKSQQQQLVSAASGANHVAVSVPGAASAGALGSLTVTNGGHGTAIRHSGSSSAASGAASHSGGVSCDFAGWHASSWNQALLRRQWPSRGEVVFKHVSVRYREGLPLVLNNLSFRIRPGMAVGCVGRTGSGKTTLSLALFRMMELARAGEAEPQAGLWAADSAGVPVAAPASSASAPAKLAPEVAVTAGGAGVDSDACSSRSNSNSDDRSAIEIDGIDISRVNVYQLRSRLAVLPQDPVLYSGTLRYNLDVFSEHSDERLLWAVERAGLAAFVSGHPAGLLRPIAEGGSNCSHGERQLIALCRALLRGAQIVVADEATSATDGATDAAVQATLRSGLRGRTLFIIAHRLQTIMDVDRVLVLAPGGRLLEYDHPAALLGLIPRREPGAPLEGTLARMVADTGPETAAALSRIALQAAVGGGFSGAQVLAPAAASMPATA